MISTPVDVSKLEELLRCTNYDTDLTKFIIDGFRNGFDLGYRGPTKRVNTANNIPLFVGTKITLWNKVMEEVQLKRFAGPFNKLPYEYYIQSPIGLVPKAGRNNKTRLIFHLSFNFGEKEEEKSFNFHTPDELCHVKYKDLDNAVKLSLQLINENLNKGESPTIFYAKSDLTAAFRQLPGIPSQFRWLCMQAEDPVTKRKKFFLDKNIPFRASRSCFLFQVFSDCLKHIVEKTWHDEKNPLKTVNYLDDFLFMNSSENDCNKMVRHFLHICDEIKLPVVAEKTEWVKRKITFLGMILDGQQHRLLVPEDKRVKALNVINMACEKRKMTVKQIQCLTGMLNLLNKAISPGRVFTR